MRRRVRWTGGETRGVVPQQRGLFHKRLKFRFRQRRTQQVRVQQMILANIYKGWGRTCCVFCERPALRLLRDLYPMYV